MARRRARISFRSVALPGAGSAETSTLALPSPDTPSFSLTTTCRSDGFFARSSTMAATRSSSDVRSSIAERIRDPGLGKDPARSRLRAEMKVPRIGSVHRDAEPQREIALEVRRVERHQMRAVRIDHQRADLLEEPRPLEQLLGERPRRPVERRHQEQPLLGVHGNHAGQAGRGSSRRRRDGWPATSRRRAGPAAAGGAAAGTGNALRTPAAGHRGSCSPG